MMRSEFVRCIVALLAFIAIFTMFACMWLREPMITSSEEWNSATLDCIVGAIFVVVQSNAQGNFLL